MNAVVRPDLFAPEVVACQKLGRHALHENDCLSALSTIPDESVDVVVTSPPYNLGISYASYEDRLSDDAYNHWMLQVGRQLARVLKPEGSFFLNLSGSGSRPWVPFDVVSQLRSLFKLQNHISWIKSVSIETTTSGHFKPIAGERFLNQNHEHIFHLTLANNVKLDRLAIGLPFEDKSNIKRWGHKRDLRCRGNTWFIPYKTIRSKAQKFYHPATFPVELPLWCIYLHGQPNPTVLDPFAGTGTTVLAAHLAGGRGIGIEIDHRYNQIAAKRIAELGNTMKIVLTAPEIDELLKQDPSTARDGGYQSLLVSLQNRVNRQTGVLTLTADDIERIARYAFEYRNGGWQDRLLKIFGRSLGPDLGRKSAA